jgi:hypothetical protein
MVSVLAIRPKFSGFKPGRGDGLGDKNLQHDFFRTGSKAESFMS